MQNQSNCGITFDTQLKTALLHRLQYVQLRSWLHGKFQSGLGGKGEGSEISARLPEQIFILKKKSAITLEESFNPGRTLDYYTIITIILVCQ